MPGLRAKMRDVDHSGRVVNVQAHTVPRRHRSNPFAQFQHGQGAQQPGCIKVMYFHAFEIGQMLHLVHSLVTAWVRKGA